MYVFIIVSWFCKLFWLTHILLDLTSHVQTEPYRKSHQLLNASALASSDQGFMYPQTCKPQYCTTSSFPRTVPFLSPLKIFSLWGSRTTHMAFLLPKAAQANFFFTQQTNHRHHKWPLPPGHTIWVCPPRCPSNLLALWFPVSSFESSSADLLGFNPSLKLTYLLLMGLLCYLSANLPWKFCLGLLGQHFSPILAYYLLLFRSLPAY